MMKTPLRFRKRPVEIEAMQWTINGVAIANWMDECGWTGPPDNDARTAVMARSDPNASGFNYVAGAVYDYLHDTWVSCTEGDWIIRGVQGEFYPCNPDVFDATYEPVDVEIPPVESTGAAHRERDLGAGDA
jgi:hypothetical protein